MTVYASRTITAVAEHVVNVRGAKTPTRVSRGICAHRGNRKLKFYTHTHVERVKYSFRALTFFS